MTPMQVAFSVQSLCRPGGPVPVGITYPRSMDRLFAPTEHADMYSLVELLPEGHWLRMVPWTVSETEPGIRVHWGRR